MEPIEIALDDPADPLVGIPLDDAEPAVAVTLVEDRFAPLVEILPADFPLPALARFVPNVALRTALEDATREALAIVVEGDAGLTKADEAFGAIRDRIKAVEEHFDAPAKIAHDLHRHITGTRAEWTDVGRRALHTLGERMVAEQGRLAAIARERARQEQAAADQRERERLAAEAAAAVEADAPAEVVEELRQQAQTATAEPVRMRPAPSAMSRSTIAKSWKARLIGTPGTDEPNPDTDSMTPAQRSKLYDLMRAIIDGRAPVAAIEVNWSYLNKRAAADKSTMQIPGVEAFQVSGLRGKAGR